jgi:hypothetical protein
MPARSGAPTHTRVLIVGVSTNASENLSGIRLSERRPCLTGSHIGTVYCYSRAASAGSRRSPEPDEPAPVAPSTMNTFAPDVA